MMLKLEITLVIKCDPGAFCKGPSMSLIYLLASPYSSRLNPFLMRSRTRANAVRVHLRKKPNHLCTECSVCVCFFFFSRCTSYLTKPGFTWQPKRPFQTFWHDIYRVSWFCSRLRWKARLTVYGGYWTELTTALNVSQSSSSVSTSVIFQCGVGKLDALNHTLTTLKTAMYFPASKHQTHLISWW